MFHKIIDKVSDVIGVLIEDPFLIFILAIELFLAVVSIMSYATATETYTVVDKEYVEGCGWSHHSYELKVRTEDCFGDHYNWVEVTPTDYNNYEIGDEYVEE